MRYLRKRTQKNHTASVKCFAIKIEKSIGDIIVLKFERKYSLSKDTKDEWFYQFVNINLEHLEKFINYGKNSFSVRIKTR